MSLSTGGLTCYGLFIVYKRSLRAYHCTARVLHLLVHPLGSDFGGDFRIIQYEDDTLIILLAKPDQLLNLQAIFSDFASSMGLKVNFSKSSMIPINVDPKKATLLAEIGSLLFTYLGLPVGMTRPAVQEFMPLLNRI